MGLDEDLAPYRQRRAELAERARRLAEEFDPDLPDRPEPDDPDELLYDSDRHRWEQLGRFKQHLGDDGWFG